MKKKIFINSFSLIALLLFASISLTAQNVLISEVLFKEKNEEVEYVEIYVDQAEECALTEILFALKDAKTKRWKFYDIGSKSLMRLQPFQYYIWTKSPEKVGIHYKQGSKENFIKAESFPSLTNTGGHIALFSKKDSLLLDEMYYDEKMHHSLLLSTYGVSLERIDFSISAMQADNWHSASKEVNYGTPACENSQYVCRIEEGEEYGLYYSDELIRPNNDGFQDYIKIDYRFPIAGYVGTIRIFDHNGRFCRMLVNRELLGTQGTAAIWDGTDAQRRLLGRGMYILVSEFTLTDGSRKVFRKGIGLL